MLGAPAGDFQSAGLQHVHSTVAGPESSFLGDQGALTGVLDVGAVTLALHVQLFSRMGRGGKERENVETITVWQTTTCKQEVSTTLSLRPNYNFFFFFLLFCGFYKASGGFRGKSKHYFSLYVPNSALIYRQVLLGILKSGGRIDLGEDSSWLMFGHKPRQEVTSLGAVLWEVLYENKPSGPLVWRSHVERQTVNVPESYCFLRKVKDALLSFLQLQHWA